MDGGNAVHIPVMLRETLFYLEPKPGDVMADCTIGAGGHAVEILAAIQPGGRLIGIDRDAEVLEIAGKNMADRGFAGCFELHHADFSDFDEALHGAVDGMLFDLGVSSLQLDRPERGFSFMAEGPLDMRMDPSRGQPASAAIRRLSEKELAGVLRDYGEERHAWRIAKAIKQAEQTTGLRTTRDLAETVQRAMPRRAERPRIAGIHPATRTFQALRIYVNQELDALAQALRKVPGRLKPGGRVVVISYHSLEDRIVKHTFREQAAGGEIEIVTRKPVRPQDDEVHRNRRSRSARLRAARKLQPHEGQ